VYRFDCLLFSIGHGLFKARRTWRMGQNLRTWVEHQKLQPTRIKPSQITVKIPNLYLLNLVVNLYVNVTEFQSSSYNHVRTNTIWPTSKEIKYLDTTLMTSDNEELIPYVCDCCCCTSASFSLASEAASDFSIKAHCISGFAQDLSSVIAFYAKLHVILLGINLSRLVDRCSIYTGL
jgi:hypothetical protein